jgi:hypothetical protein
MRRLVLLVGTLGIVMASTVAGAGPAGAVATTRTWVGPAGGAWSEPGNWSPLGAPVDGDSLVFPTGPTLDDIANLTVHDVIFTGHGGIDGAPGASLIVAGGVSVAPPAPLPPYGFSVQWTMPLQLAAGLRTVTVASPTLPLILNGPIATVVGPGTLVKRGAGQLVLGPADDGLAATGGMVIEEGWVQAPPVLQGSAPITVSAGATLALSNSAVSSPLTIAGAGFAFPQSQLATGAITGLGTITGPVTVSGTGATVAAWSNVPLTFSGPITGPGKLVVDGRTSGNQNWSTVVLERPTAMVGGIDVIGGILRVTSPVALGSGPVSVSPGSRLEPRASMTIANPLTLAGEGVDGEGPIVGVRGSRTVLTGPVVLAGPTVLGGQLATGFGVSSEAELEIAGPISGPGDLSVVGGPIVVSGAGASTHTGVTVVLEAEVRLRRQGAAISGDLVIDEGGHVVLEADDQLGDSATVFVGVEQPTTSGSLRILDLTGHDDTVGAVVMEDAGTLVLGSLAQRRFSRLRTSALLTDYSYFAFSIVGTRPGVDADQIRVEGPVVAGAVIDVHDDAARGPSGAVTIIDNDGTDPVDGLYRDRLGPLTEGDVFLSDTRRPYRISYVGGDGNDVTLTPMAAGYWMLGAGGQVYGFGTAAVVGDPIPVTALTTTVDLEPTPTGTGYWVVDSLGNVTARGDAPDLGSVAIDALQPGERAASLAATPTGGGYWVFSDRGRVWAFGDARPFGDLSAVPLNGPVLDAIPTPTGQGYFMVATDGGIFGFGDAVFRGSMGDRPLNQPVESLVPTESGRGYWLVAADGGVFAFGDAGFRGSIPAVLQPGQVLNRPVIGMVRFGDGYLMVGEDGGIFTFSDLPFLGSLGDHPPNRPITAVATIGR